MNFLILAGGGGTRLWPLSRQDYPKQFQSLNPNDARQSSLMVDTIKRLQHNAADRLQNVFLLTSLELADAVEQSLEAHNFSHLKANIVSEPCRRNTAPAIALAAQYIHENADNDDTVLCILPADHQIDDAASFRQQLAEAASLAKAGYIVTLGIKPTRPETGYGYIEIDQIEPGKTWQTVNRFVEKPSYDVATGYVASGRYLWNAGIFVLSVNTLMTALQTHSPDIYRLLQKGYSYGLSHFAEFPDISFDYAVMEKATKVAVIPLKSGWSDIGSWDSAFDNAASDHNGNIALTSEAPLFHECENARVWSNTAKTIACIGVSNITVVNTADAMLICQNGHSQDVRHIVQRLTTTHNPSLFKSTKWLAAWGSIHQLSTNDSELTPYLIQIKPGQSIQFLSLNAFVSITVISGCINNDGSRLSTGSVILPGMINENNCFQVNDELSCQLIYIGCKPQILNKSLMSELTAQKNNDRIATFATI